MRILATFAAGFAGGIFLAQYLLPDSLLLPAAVLCLIVAIFALLFPERWRRKVLLVFAALSLALGYNWLYIRQVQRPMEAQADRELPVVMTLCEYAVPTESGAKVTVRAEGFPAKLMYYGSEALLELQPGQTVSTEVRLQSASRIRDDDVTSFTSKGVFLLAYFRGEEAFGEGSRTALRWWPVRIGRTMRETLATLFEGDTAAFLSAILTGEKSGLSVQASADLSEAGLYHILAVSGMHCGFLLTMVTVLIGKHRRKLIAGSTILLLLFYAVLTGGSPSVLRACVMLILLLAAPLFGRESDGPTALAAALLLILLKNPFAAASISLQLSFAAMAGILWLTPRLYNLLSGRRKHGKVFSFIATGFSATVGALVFTIPLSAYYFETLTLISPLSNLVCLWAASLIFILGLAAVAAGALCPPLGALIALPVRLLTGYILAAAHFLAELPYHAVYYANPYLKYWLIFLYVLFLAACLLRGGRRKYLLAAVLATITLAVTLHLGETRYNADLDAVVLDVGQGQCVLLASEGRFALVDCGSSNSWYDPGETAAQQLAALGCRKLDYLILTHFDSDHINGVPELLARMDVETVLVPEGESTLLAELKQQAGTLETVREIRTMDFGPAELTILPPVGEENDNDRGLSVLASAGEQDLLLTGDMSSSAEEILLERYDLPDIEILVAGHHGSRTSTSAVLLEALTPETVCISVGSNSYGHPAKETMRRIAEHGCAIYRTDLHGDVHLSLND